MPFKSEKQRRYLYAKEPEIARRWTEKYGSKARKKKKGLLAAYKDGGEKLGR